MRISPLLQAATVVLLAGCQSISQACTLAACSNALNVAFSRAPTGPYRLEIFPDGSPNGWVYDCADPATCPTASFSGLKASRVTIVLTAGGVTSTQTFTPEYATVYPNGRGCPGRCEQATVTVQV